MTDAVPQDLNQLKVLIEAMVLVSDGPVPLDVLAKALEVDLAQVQEAVSALEQDYAGRGIRLQRLRERVQWVTAPETADQIQKFLGLDVTARLSPAALETLAIIAYRQPVTRPQVEAIRGVNCDGVMHNLMARGLIEEIGRLETVGHPIEYATTFEFLQYFGYSNLDQLPPLPDDARPRLPTIPLEIKASSDEGTSDSLSPIVVDNGRQDSDPGPI